MKKIFMFCFILLSVLLIACTPAEKFCNADTDCTRATCCHVKEAINIEFAPDCDGQMCTMECVPGTIDCGQGEIKCVSGECKVVLDE